MRVLIVSPGPAYSVKDVYNGWVKGLRAYGVEVIEYPFEDRLWAAQHFHVKNDSEEWVQAFPFEMAVLYALEPIGSWIYETQPDLVLFVTGFWIKAAPLDLIRARGARVGLVFTESPYEDDVQLERAGHADICVVNDPTNLGQFQDLCPLTMYAPHSYDPEVHRPGPVVPGMESDLCVVGTGFPSRVEYLERADLSGLDVAILGNWTSLQPGSPLIECVRQDDLEACVDNHDTIRWYNSTHASVNLYRREANRPDLVAGWSMGPREVELAASGTFFLTEPRGENREVLPMVPLAGDADGFGERLRWWLDHPAARERVILRARAAVHDWTFANRAAQFLELFSKL